MTDTSKARCSEFSMMDKTISTDMKKSIRTRVLFAAVTGMMAAMVLYVSALCNITGILMMTTEPTEIKASASEGSATVAVLDANSPVYVTGNGPDGYYTVYYQGNTCYIRSDKVVYLEIAGNNNPDRILGKDNNVKDSAVSADEINNSDVDEEVLADIEGLQIEIEDKDALAAEVTRMQKEADEKKLNNEAIETPNEAIEAELEEASEEGDYVATEFDRIKKETIRTIVWTTIIAMLVVGILVVGIYMTVLNNRNKCAEDEPNEDDNYNADDYIVQDGLAETDAEEIEFIDLNNE